MEPARLSRSTRTTEVMEAIRTRIAGRILAPGDRLPSIRRFAETMAVSPSTVVEAYDRLAAEGLIRARPGSGFYVSGAALPPLSFAVDPGLHDRAVDPFWVSRQSLEAPPEALKPGCGWLPADWMPTEALRKALRAVARADDALLTDYGGVLGSRALRRILLGRLATEGLQLGQDQVLLTGSGTHAVDLTCRYLLRPGDTVVVDDPCYFNFRALLRAHQVQVVGVPYTPTGPDVERFEAVLEQASPRLYLTNAGLQNPTGAGIAPQTAHRLLNLAAAHDLAIIEDDLFADLEPEPTTRLAALDGLNRVIRIGSFSKTLSASLRCGYIAARVDRISDLADLQVATGFVGASPVAAEAIAHVLAGGGYRKHLDEVHRRLARKRREVIARLRSIGVEPWIEPRGGFNLWCRLPGEIDSAELARAALKEDIVLAPGDVFSPSQTASRFMRVNVTHCDDPRLMSFLRLGLSG